MSGSGNGGKGWPQRATAAALAMVCIAGSLGAQHRAKSAAHASHAAAHAAARTGSRASTRATATRAKIKTGGTQRGGSRARAARRGAAGYGTAARTSYRATVDPMSRLDLIAGLAETLAHGHTAIRYPAALDSFYAALAANTEQPASLPVRVLQFGDSHTAADMFTGEARRVFQGQFGNGGVGFTYAGHPFAGYRILGSSRAQSGGWRTLGTHFTDLGDAMTGLGGVAVETYRPDEWVSEDALCSSFEVEYLQQPGGGTLQLTDNGTVAGQIDTAAAATGAGSFRYDCPAAQPGYETLPHHFVATTLGHAPVRLLGTVALQPGVTWESMGINGAEAPLMLRWEQTLFTAYLARTAASLVVLAYGTNEAAGRWTYESYSEVFTRLIEKLHATLPNAAVLVLGPTDRAIAASTGRGRHRHTYYSAFAGTERIMEAQRDVCRAHGCTFWDAQQRMGGFGSMQKWVLAGWAQPDHTHLTGEGYRTLADALLADLLSGYDAYRLAHGLPAQPLRGTGASSGETATPTAAPVTKPVPITLPPTPPTQVPRQ